MKKHVVSVQLITIVLDGRLLRDLDEIEVTKSLNYQNHHQNEAINRNKPIRKKSIIAIPRFYQFKLTKWQSNKIYNQHNKIIKSQN